MLKLSDLKKQLKKDVGSFLKPKGFKRSGDSFNQESEIGFNRMNIVIAYYATAGSWLNFAATIFIESLDETLKEFHNSTRGYQNDNYHVLIGNLTALKNETHPYRQDILTLEDVEDALNSFYVDYDKNIHPFFDQYSTIEAVESYLNRNFELSDLLLPKNDKAMIGITLAHLLNKENVKEIFDNYMGSWQMSTFDDNLKKHQILELEQLIKFLGYS